MKSFYLIAVLVIANSVFAYNGDKKHFKKTIKCIHKLIEKNEKDKELSKKVLDIFSSLKSNITQGDGFRESYQMCKLFEMLIYEDPELTYKKQTLLVDSYTNYSSDLINLTKNFIYPISSCRLGGIFANAGFGWTRGIGVSVGGCKSSNYQKHMAIIPYIEKGEPGINLLLASAGFNFEHAFMFMREGYYRRHTLEGYFFYADYPTGYDNDILDSFKDDGIFGIGAGLSALMMVFPHSTRVVRTGPLLKLLRISNNYKKLYQLLSDSKDQTL